MKDMHVWLLQTWEPNPIDDPNGRPWRTGILAQRLLANGHKVTWFASNFSHSTKKFRSAKPGPVEISKDFTIWLIDALGYEKHVSLRRLKDHKFVAKQFALIAHSLEIPDIIVASYPTIETCEQAAIYAKSKGIPLLIDIRDQYPDLYWENSGGLKQTIIKAGCKISGMEKMAQRALAGATGVTGNGPEVVAWGIQKARRYQGEFDQPLFMSYQPKILNDEERSVALVWWKQEHGVQPGDRLVIYAGMLGQTIDFETLLGAAKLLPDTKFIICGGGDKLSEFKSSAQNTFNMKLTGWLDSLKIQCLMEIAEIGLIPYIPSPNFEKGITNKPVEYLSNGLPILTTLHKGTLVELMNQHGAGLSYETKNINHLVKQVNNIYSNKEAMSRNARNLFETNFHPDQIYGQWIKIIEHLAQENRKD